MAIDEAMIERMKALGAPGEGHARLEPMAGEWTTETRMWMGTEEPIVTTGRVEKTWILGGRFLEERLEGVGPTGEAYTGRGLLGFHNARGCYEGTWVSDGGTGILRYEGTINEAGDLVCAGVELDPMGSDLERPFRVQHHIEGPDSHVMSMHYAAPDGGYFKAFEIRHTRA